MKRLIFCICLVGVMLVETSAYAQGTRTPTNIRFTETALSRLGQVPADAKEVIVNDEGTLAVSVAERNKKQYVVINGKEGPAFDWVARPGFSADGDHVHYFANRGGERSSDRWTSLLPEGGEWFDVLDNAAGPAYMGLKDLAAGRPKPPTNPEPAWQSSSIDGKRSAFVAKQPGKWHMVVDGRAGTPYEWVAWPIFSPDGKRFAYVAYQPDRSLPSGRHFVVVDGNPGPVYDNVDGSSLCFSPDSRQLAYRAQRIDKGVWYFPVINGKEGRTNPAWYRGLGPVFSNDSKLAAYSTWRDTNHLVIVNDFESKLYEKVWLPKNQDEAKIRFYGLNKGTIYVVEARAS